MTVKPMTVEDAIRELRAHFRRKAQHPHDCICACCEAIEVLAMAVSEDAPGGPWKLSILPTMLVVMDGGLRVTRCIEGFYGDKERIAVRDALNRLKGDAT